MRHHSLAGSIAFAEAASTIMSFASVWFTTTQKSIIGLTDPVKDFVAEKVIYPILSHKPYVAGTNDADMEKARDKASMFFKGVIMIGTDFTVTVPMQMLAEGDCSRNALKQAAKGKAFGIGTTLVTLEILNRTMPGIMRKVEDEIIKRLPQCMKTEQADGSDLQKEIANLSVVAIPSAVISGIVSYLTQKKGMER